MDNKISFFVTPEKIAHHIAKKIKFANGICTIVDAFAGVGGNSIQFAKECEIVIAIEKDIYRADNLEKNASIYGVSSKIDIVVSDFLQRGIQKIKGDLVFIHPDYENDEANFSIFTHVFPDIRKTMKIAFEISPNIILLLPKCTPLEEIAELFGEIDKKYFFKSNSIYVEILQIQEKIDKIAIYYGEDINPLSLKEEKDFLLSKLNEDNTSSFVYKENKNFVNYALSKQGMRNCCEILSEIEGSSGKEDYNHTIIQRFRDLFVEKKLLQTGEIHKETLFKPQSIVEKNYGNYKLDPNKYFGFEKPVEDSMKDKIEFPTTMSSKEESFQRKLKIQEIKENSTSPVISEDGPLLFTMSNYSGKINFDSPSSIKNSLIF